MNQSNAPKKLFGGRQIALSVLGAFLGFGFAGAKIYAEHGRFEKVHIVAAVIMMFVFAIILLVVRHLANRDT